MPAQALDQVSATGKDPRLRATEELVSREADDVGTCSEARRRRRLVADRRQRARAEVVDQRKAGTSRDLREVGERGLLGEADHPEVRLMHAEEDGGLRTDRALVVGDTGPVGGADLDEARARACKHVRDPEAVADLDQLATRDEHLPPLGERRQGEHYGGGIVVDDERSFGPRDPPQQPGEVILPRSTRAALEVVLEVRVAATDLHDAVERSLSERGATEIRVDENAGGVDDPP